MFLDQILLTSAAVLANILGVSMLLPQASRITRTRSTEGVSGAWIGAGIAINSGWLAYGLLAGVAGLVPVSTGSLALYVWLFVVAAPLDRSIAMRTPIITGGIAVLLFSALKLGGVYVLGLSLSGCYSVQFAPAAWAAIRQAELSALSRATWAMALVEALLWLAYGTGISDLPVALGGVGASVASLVILFRLHRRQPTRSANQVPELPFNAFHVFSSKTVSPGNSSGK